MSFIGILTVNHDKKTHYMATNCPFPIIAKSLYEISLAMCDITSKKVLDVGIGTSDLSKFEKEKKWKRKGLILVKSGRVRYKYVLNKRETLKAIPVFYREDLGSNIPDHQGSRSLEIPTYQIKNISIFKGKIKIFTLPYLKYTNCNCLRMENNTMVDSMDIKDIINQSLTKSYLQKVYDTTSKDLSESLPCEPKKREIFNFPFEAKDIHKIQSLLPDEVIFKGQREIDKGKGKQLLEESKLKLLPGEYEHLATAFNFDYSKIELLDMEEEVGLIDEDRTLFNEESKLDEGIQQRLFNITADSYFGDLGVLTDIRFYNENYLLPYTYRMAENCCDHKYRTCELNLSITDYAQVKIKSYIKIKIMAWYLMNFGETEFELYMGRLLEEKK